MDIPKPCGTGDVVAGYEVGPFYVEDATFASLMKCFQSSVLLEDHPCFCATQEYRQVTRRIFMELCPEG